MMPEPGPHPMVEVTGAEILENSAKILDVIQEMNPEVAISSLILLAYALLRGEALDAENAQRVLNQFTTMALSGPEGVQ